MSSLLSERNTPDSIDGVPFEEIYELFANSSYGERLRRAIRFGAYKPPETTNEEWVKVLGPDVHNLEHLLWTLSIARDFLRSSLDPHEPWQGEVPEEARFNEGEQKLLLLTAVMHDWGESVVGDILWHRKNSHDEKEDLKALGNIIGELCEGKYSDELVSKMHQVGNILFRDKNSKLGRAFNAIEHVGYGQTAILAWEKHFEYEGPLSHSLLGIAAKLIENHLSDRRGKSEIYPASHYFLLKNQKPIQEIIEARIDWRSIPGFDA
ncbi:MAG: hypothetical protein HYY99_00650 [Candidatus Colwellbacteria bacterium]|nr:hypothetical protein [Candidatus Colwellbacteria bacterium]